MDDHQSTFQRAYILALARAVEIQGVALPERARIAGHLRCAIEKGLAEGVTECGQLADSAISFAREQLQIRRSRLYVVGQDRDAG